MSEKIMTPCPFCASQANVLVDIMEKALIEIVHLSDRGTRFNSLGLEYGEIAKEALKTAKKAAL